MPTTVVSSIGTTGRDYSTLQAWEDACPANLVTDDKIWKGECYNDSEFTAGVTISGQTTSSTCHVWLTAASGQSFIDNASVRSNALMYDQSKGVGVKVGPGADTSAIIYGVAAYTLIERLQVKRTAGSTYDSGWTIATDFTANGSAVKDCICESNLATVRYTAAPQGNKFTNCLVVSTSGARGVATNSGGALLNCTVVGTSGSADVGIVCNYFSGTIKNTAIFGFTTNVSTGYTAGMSYNGTDKSSIGGSNNQTSLTFSACFESTTNDFRLKAGSSLIGVGDTDATNAPLDISGFTRGAGTAGDIGAWEYGASTSNSLKPQRFRQIHLLVR